jgi:hypothetical protein
VSLQFTKAQLFVAADAAVARAISFTFMQDIVFLPTFYLKCHSLIAVSVKEM